MEKPDQLRELFRMQQSFNGRIGVHTNSMSYCKKNEVNFKRQDSGYAEKDHADSRHI
jgi:hypothetical protein